jgi:redox-sensitive bicupin YhaK (pirin superfamily)
LNLSDDLVRVIQIWFVADPEYQGLDPHYQQLSRDQLPAYHIGDATVYKLIGDGSPMEQHMTGRLTAAIVNPGGKTELEPPCPGEDLFVYFTDGAGQVQYNGKTLTLGQYDVILARPDMEAATIMADTSAPLHFMSFYLPKFLA